MQFSAIVGVSERVRATRSRTAKIAAIAELLAGASPHDVAVAVSYLSGDSRRARLGVGYATVAALEVPAVATPSLTVADVESALDTMATASGAGSQTVRRNSLEALLRRATESEQRFLRGLVLGELRQGALEGVVTEAVARAAGVPAADVRRAAMVAGDLSAVGAAVIAAGVDGLDRFRLTLFQPVQPMLAQTSDDVAAGLARLGGASVEYKLDGARVQVHRDGDAVAVYTRNLRDVTDRVPEVVAAVLDFPAEKMILDGESLALRDDGTPYPFQDSMSRFGTERDDAPVREAVGLRPFFFDVLHLDGDDLIDQPLRRRHEALDRAVPESNRVPRLVPEDGEQAEAFLRSALAAGHEGVMVKGLDSTYEAGRRGAAWLKVKPTHTLDLVVLAVEWGSGRRKGWLSNLHLGARDPRTGEMVMLGKTFKGLTDEMLAWQTQRFLELEIRRTRQVVHVRPEQVVEIAFDGVQRSSRYPGGVALRFARVKGYRPDKGPHDADTIDTVLAIHRGEVAPTL